MDAPIIETANDRTDENNDRIWVGVAYIAFALGYFYAPLALLGVIIAYVRKDASPAWLETHYISQIQTFWRVLIALILAGLSVVAIILTALDVHQFDVTSMAWFGLGGGIVTVGLTLIWVWVLVRSVGGIIRLINHQKVDKPYGYWI
jgi:uncharacterized membrane protein